MTDSPTIRRQKPAVLTVSRLTQDIKRMLEGGFSRLWVEGELSNFRPAGSGHWYGTLKDSRAQIGFAMFRSQTRNVAFRPKDGDQIQVVGRLSVYEPRGNYQLILERMQPAGRGRLQEEFEKLKARLAEEGLFAPERKQALPSFPRTIALVTSPTGAAVRDMIRVIHRRMPATRLIVVPAVVQGEGASASLERALANACRIPQVELILVGRGGGSLEDLWAFNEERTARAIAACTVPTLSAVGHEIDVTIADFVADARAATPSQAGELAVPVQAELSNRLAVLASRLHRAMLHRVKDARLQLNRVNRGLVSPQRRLYTQRQRLDEARQTLMDVWRNRLGNRKERLRVASLRLERRSPQTTEAGRSLEQLSGRLVQAQQAFVNRQRTRFGENARNLREHSPENRLRDGFQRLGLAKQSLIFFTQKQINTGHQSLSLAANRLDSLSPLNTLQRGYSITTLSGKVLTDADHLLPNMPLDILLHKGRVTARVVEVNPSHQLDKVR